MTTLLLLQLAALIFAGVHFLFARRWSGPERSATGPAAGGHSRMSAGSGAGD